MALCRSRRNYRFFFFFVLGANIVAFTVLCGSVMVCVSIAQAAAGSVRLTPLKNGGDHYCCGRFGPLRNRPPVFWCHFLESWLQDGESREKTRKNGAKMGEIWPKKKSAGRRPICDG
eukprot:COSAG04_NODE_356_length_16034_cov_11.195168_15_plen_117_part_00